MLLPLSLASRCICMKMPRQFCAINRIARVRSKPPPTPPYVPKRVATHLHFDLIKTVGGDSNCTATVLACMCVLSRLPTDACLAFFANFSAWRQANWNLCGNFMAHLPQLQLPEWIYRGQNGGKWAGQQHQQQQQHSNKKTKLKQTTRKWNITEQEKKTSSTLWCKWNYRFLIKCRPPKLTVSNEVLRTAIWCRAMANRLAIHNARQLALLSTRPERIRALDGFYCVRAKPQKVVNWFYALFQLTSSWCSDCSCCCCWSA